MDPMTMEGAFIGSEDEKEDVEETTSHLRDRFRLSTISIAESEAKQNNMEISQPVIVCISDLAFKYAEQLAEDLETFAHHAGRKVVNVNDVIISAHRNKHLADLLRAFSSTLKSKEPQAEKKRKKSSSSKEGKSVPATHNVDPILL